MNQGKLQNKWAREADALFEQIAEGGFDSPAEAFEALQSLYERVPDSLDELKARISRWMEEVGEWADREFLDDDVSEYFDEDEY